MPGSTNAKSGSRAARNVGSVLPRPRQPVCVARHYLSRRSGRSIEIRPMAGTRRPWAALCGCPGSTNTQLESRAARRRTGVAPSKRGEEHEEHTAARHSTCFLAAGIRPRARHGRARTYYPVRMAREHEHERATVEQHDVARRRRRPPRGQHEHTAVVALHQYPVASWSCHDGPPARIDTLPARLPVLVADPGHAAAG